MSLETEIETEIAAFLAAARGVLEPAAGQGGGAAPMLRAVLGELEAPAAPRTPAPARRPACRHLARGLALAAAPGGAVGALAAAFGALEPRLTWIQNPNYGADTLGADYIDNYAYVDVVGPRGLVPNDRVSLGVLLLGPGLHYPDHSHPAEELYVPLTGDALWRRAGGPWKAKPAGSAIHHPPATPHATKSGREPLLAFYAWLGALDEPARLLG